VFLSNLDIDFVMIKSVFPALASAVMSWNPVRSSLNRKYQSRDRLLQTHRMDQTEWFPCSVTCQLSSMSYSLFHYQCCHIRLPTSLRG
jgi:hypothetical protein